MSINNDLPERDPHQTANPLLDEHTVLPTATPMSRWQRARFLFKVIEIRFRMIAILVVTFLLIGYWDTLKNYWDKWTRPSMADVSKVDSKLEYFCSMHPQVRRAGLEPNGEVPKCPICGMPLTLHAKGHGAVLPAGILSRVQLSPERIQLAGVQTSDVAYRALKKEIHTVGSVDYDEGLRSQIVARTAGYVEKLYVNETYTTVKEGDPLAEIYSPELYSTVHELQLAKKRGAKELVESGKERLRLLGIDEQEIDDILRSSNADSRITIRAPQPGHIIDKKIVQGARVEAGMTLFEVADLSDVWIEGEVFEKDIPFLRDGQEIEATVESMPNKVFKGTVSLVHPHLEANTRTNRVRFVVGNEGHILRPGMYASVTIKVPLEQIEPFKSRLAAVERKPAGTDDKSLIAFQKNCPITGRELGTMGPPVKIFLASKPVFLCCKGCVDEAEENGSKVLAKLDTAAERGILAVPERAVIDTGAKQIVYVEREPGVFEGVQVELGPRVGGFYPVVKGLNVGDHIASAGAFLIDAETRLNPEDEAGDSAAPTTGGTPSPPKPAP